MLHVFIINVEVPVEKISYKSEMVTWEALGESAWNDPCTEHTLNWQLKMIFVWK